MADETSKPKLAVVAEELDEDEIEFKKLRRDLPGVKGASAIGIVTINVNKNLKKTSSSGRILTSCRSFRSSISRLGWSGSSSP